MAGYGFNRRRLLLGAAAFGAAGVGPAAAAPRGRRPGIAFTFDDFELWDGARMGGLQRDAVIRRALAHRRISAMGLVSGMAFHDPARARDVLRHWSDAGHLIGNHSFSHAHFDGGDPAGFEADLLRQEALLRPVAGFRKFYRFPFLAEGATPAGRDAMRAVLARHGYRPAPVTIVTSDWLVEERLRARLAADPHADVAPYRRYFIAHVLERAAQFDALARALFDRPIDHVLLLHHWQITPIVIEPLMAAFAARGWRFADAGAAFDQPELRTLPAIAPAGGSLLVQIADARGAAAAEREALAAASAAEPAAMAAAGL